MSGSSAAAREVGNQSRWLMILVGDGASYRWNPVSPLPVGVLLITELGHATVGPGVHVGTMVGAV